MLRAIFILSLLSLLVISCYKDNSVEAPTGTPEWLQAKIDSMSQNQDYYGTTVYRYKWNGAYVYHIVIPISSCAFCDVYNQSGIKLQFANDAQFQEFLNNRTDAVLIWEWPIKL